MRPSEVRESVLSDHELIRAMLAELEATAREVAGGKVDAVGRLRMEGQALLERLLEHMAWEDRYLRPALLQADAWGEERAARLDADHQEQRDVLSHALSRVGDGSRPPPVLARELTDLAELVRTDMQDEEEALLDERVLRDDVVAIDVEAG